MPKVASLPQSFTEEIKIYQDPGISISQPSTKPPIYHSTNHSLTTSPSKFPWLLDPFRDTWRKVKLSRNVTVYLFSAFYDDRNNNKAVIRINMAAHTKFKVRAKKFERCNKLTPFLHTVQNKKSYLVLHL